MDIKYIALQDWVDWVLLHDIASSDHTADAFTKVLSKIFFYRHYVTYMGWCIPDFRAKHLKSFGTHINTNSNEIHCSSLYSEHGEGIMGNTSIV